MTAFAFTALWRKCPECGRGDGSDHTTTCSKGRKPEKHDYSGAPRSPATGMDGTLGRVQLRRAIDNFRRQT